MTYLEEIAKDLHQKFAYNFTAQPDSIIKEKLRVMCNNDPEVEQLFDDLVFHGYLVFDSNFSQGKFYTFAH